MKHINIAIDGPSGAGKSTMAKLIADELDIILVDTGAMYRAIGLYVYRKGAVPTDEAAVTALLPEIDIAIEYDEERSQHVLLNGEDVSSAIREPEISMYASHVSALGPVRAFLLDLQRDMARRNSVVMDGRDIGTVILPDADVKIFLTASDETRAMRRLHQLEKQGEAPPFEEVLRDLRKRDEQDSTRALAPLKPAEDAVIVDSSAHEKEETLGILLGIIREKTGV